MCGLAGFWHRDGQPADATLVARMLDRQQHRGPDDRGTVAIGPIGLGLDRLSVMDLSPLGHQPFATPDGQSVLVYNGEIYNWRMLRRELEAEGVPFMSACDTEVVLHALHRWGPDVALPRFNGMFALAWFDRRTQTLCLARDRTGIKPLYTAECGTVLAFASEAKALFAHPAIVCRPDLHALVTHVYLDRLAGDWTAFEGVRMVVPGTMQRWSAVGCITTTWYDPERDVDVERLIAAMHDPQEHHVQRVRDALEASIVLHLDSDAPLAVMCSGGLDSSLTTALAKRHRPDLVAFVAEAEGLGVSEADKAQRVADHVGIPLHRVKIVEADFPRLLARAAWHNDEPIFFHQSPLALRVCEAVRDAGFKVLLTGEGADEFFGGYGWQEETARMWRLRQWHARLLPNIAPLRRVGRWLQWLVPLDLEELAREPLTPRSEIGKAPYGQDLVIDAGMRRHRARTLFERFRTVPHPDDRAFLARAFDDIYHHLRVLLQTNDKMTMASSIEARVPFLENAVMDIGLHLPPAAKRGAGQSKRTLKAVATGLLPQEIIHARKIGFAVPNQFQAGYVPFLRGGIVADLFKWGSREQADREAEMTARPFLGQKLVRLELWAQMHLNGATPDALADRMHAVREQPVRS